MIQIRDIQLEDSEALASMISEFTHLEVTPAQVRQRLVRSRGIEHPLLAELDGQAAGFASLRLLYYLGEDVPYAEISELFVSRSYRRQGIGQALMAELEVRARAAGASSLAVLTSEENEPAFSLYRAREFRPFCIALQKWFTDERPYREG